jgi:O-antigen ligase
MYAAVLVPVGAALLLSFSRGALLLGVPAGILTLGFLAGRRWRRVAAVLLLVFLVALIPLFSTPRFAGLLDTHSGTTFFRLALWRSAWNMVRDHPLLGVGPDNFLYAYRTRYVLPSAWEEFDLAHPHNWLFDFASRLGLLGLAVFVWIEVGFWRRAWMVLRHAEGPARALALGVMGSMAACLAHGLVDAAFFYVDLAYVFFFSLALIHWIGRHSRAHPDVKEGS